jgi:hypothetical protein
MMAQAYGNFTDMERNDYGLLCRKSREMMGLTDGLRLDSDKFNRYVDERRTGDAAQRPGGQGIYIPDPSRRCILASRW